jgi:hypothetical protein
MMKTYARIQDQMVAELLTTDLDISARYNPALVWVDVTTIAGIAPGWQQNANGFSPPAASPAPPTPSLAQLQAQLAVISAQLATFSPAS